MTKIRDTSQSLRSLYLAADVVDALLLQSRWTRVIYDTTMALDLAPPNFKAYYRRGVALARLKLWTKAIAGQLVSILCLRRVR